VTDDLEQRLRFAEGLAIEAGAEAHRWFRDLDSLHVEHKGPQDVVSEADRSVERMIRAAIAKAFPDDGFLGEESGSAQINGDRPIWVVDPIDGTQCFLAGIPTWCVSIGLVSGGRPVGGVIRDPNAAETFTGLAGHGATCNGRPMAPTDSGDFTSGLTEVGFSRRIPAGPTVRLIHDLIDAGGIYHRGGSGALGLAYVAAGRYIAYFEGHMNSWDSVAGIALISAAGGWTNDILHGNGLLDGAVIAASGQRLAPALKELAGSVGYTVLEPPG